MAHPNPHSVAARYLARQSGQTELEAMHDDLHRRVAGLRDASQAFLVPDGLITAFEKLVLEMQKNDPDKDIRIGGWDVGNFGMPSRRKLEFYNKNKGGLPYASPTGFTVEMFGTLFDERGDEKTTGWSLVRQIDDPTVDRLWKAAKREADSFVADSKRSKTGTQMRTAGEVRFIKDRSGDQNEWGWGTPGPSEREIESGFEFKPNYLKPLAESLRSALMALGHVTSAHGRFVKIKSRNISPDGNLGGKGYIQKIPDMRRQLMNCIESLSAYTDTVYDEIQAPHWDNSTAGGGNRERVDVEQIMDDAEGIKDDPEGWAEDQEEEMDEDHHGPSPSPTKTARSEGVGVQPDFYSVAERFLRGSP